MRHLGTVELHTPCLTLRRLMPADAAQMYANWASDPAVTRYLRWSPHENENATRTLLAAWAELYANLDYYQWAMVENATGQVIGTISLFDDRANPPSRADAWAAPLDDSAGSWQPGYCMGKAWWGKGYMTEALRAVTDYWFGPCEGEWLGCCHDVGNPASGRVMEHAGFVYDHNGTDHKFDGTPVECKYYYLTRTMWADHKKR